MPERKLTWYEFFAGGGMARVGLGASWHCVFANDVCEKKAAAYRAYFGKSEELNVEDVRHLSTKDLPNTADLVWSSFPCQDLSLAGAGAGLQGKRSGTFAPFWKLMRGLISEGRKPRLVVLENVVGAISSHGGRDFATLVRTVSQSGYRVGPLVINAVHFLPQSRPRLFVVAVRDDEPIAANLVSKMGENIWHAPSLVKSYENLPSLLKKSWVWWNLPDPRGIKVATLSSLIEREPSGVKWHTRQETSHLISLMSDLNRRKLREVQRTGKLRIGTLYKRTRPIRAGNAGRRVQRAEVRFDEISGCLRTPVGGSSRQVILVVEGKEIKSRLLSPREAARLMGVPEDYPIPSRYNDAYHLFGDGLAIPVVSWLESRLLRPLALRQGLERVA